MAQTSPPAGSTDLETLQSRDRELEAVRDAQRKALEVEAALKREIKTIGDDRRKLNAQLIESAAKLREAEERAAKSEERLTALDADQRDLQASLNDRRAVIAEVLAALQRMGRRPPPAILVRPEDALRSVRAAITLGAVLPSMRKEAEALAAELAELIRVRKEIAAEHDLQAETLATQTEERRKLELLVAERQKRLAEVEKQLAEQRQGADALSQRAANLKDLIVTLEQHLDAAARAAREAAAASAERKALDTSPALAALKDPGRLTPAVAFASAKGLLPLPVNGVRMHEFGDPDGLGGSEHGLSMATRPGAQVTAPCDGWVVYAGPFRNYGQLLILNAGDGYHVVLAGMKAISVDLGQFVLTGEPVAEMGGRSGAAAAIATGSSQPVLYVEFRKDGVPIDPGPWWASQEGEKVRG